MATITSNSKRFFYHRGFTLAWEIALVLAVKFLLLWLLWYFFFSAPAAKHMQLPEHQVMRHLLSSDANQASPPTTKSASTHHDR